MWYLFYTSSTFPKYRLFVSLLYYRSHQVYSLVLLGIDHQLSQIFVWPFFGSCTITPWFQSFGIICLPGACEVPYWICWICRYLFFHRFCLNWVNTSSFPPFLFVFFFFGLFRYLMDFCTTLYFEGRCVCVYFIVPCSWCGFWCSGWIRTSLKCSTHLFAWSPSFIRLIISPVLSFTIHSRGDGGAVG